MSENSVLCFISDMGCLLLSTQRQHQCVAKLEVSLTMFMFVYGCVCAFYHVKLFCKDPTSHSNKSDTDTSDSSVHPIDSWD